MFNSKKKPKSVKDDYLDVLLDDYLKNDFHFMIHLFVEKKRWLRNLHLVSSLLRFEKGNNLIIYFERNIGELLMNY